MKNTIILITGGTGSWGYELTKQLLTKNPLKIKIFSRGELAQVNMSRYFNDNRLEFIIGDVRDYDALNDACKGVNYVIHLAALKHVPICELQPNESIKTNIDGVNNLIKACINNNVNMCIDVSTDKAVLPINTYGMTKAIGEKLIIDANKYQKTNFKVIRGGNVLGSNGSVIPYWITQIKSNKPLKITDKRMTRFFMLLPDAISLIFKAIEYPNNGIFVMNMPSFKMYDVAKMISLMYNRTEYIEEIGIRDGEKLHEILISEQESMFAKNIDNNLLYINKNNSNCINKIISSEYNLKDDNYLFEILKEGGFL